MEDNGLEPMTSTMPLFGSSDGKPAIYGAKRDACERLHQWLHLAALHGGGTTDKLLIQALAETLGTPAIEQLILAVRRRVERVDPARSAMPFRWGLKKIAISCTTSRPTKVASD